MRRHPADRPQSGPEKAQGNGRPGSGRPWKGPIDSNLVAGETLSFPRQPPWHKVLLVHPGVLPAGGGVGGWFPPPGSP